MTARDLDRASASARDQANRAFATREQQRLLDEKTRLASSGDKPAQLWFAQRKLTDLAVITQILHDRPDAKLLMLDTTSGNRTMTALALGDPDTADHIAVSTPGANIGVSPAQGRFLNLTGSLPQLIEEAAALKSAAEHILDKHRPEEHHLQEHGQENQTVAVVVWLGYQNPNHDGPDQRATLRGRLSMYSDKRARTWAPQLSRFYEGLAAVRPASRIVAIGHSYGSLITYRALRITPPGVVSDVVFCGSPGIRARSDDREDQLGVAAGHVWAQMADKDEIQTQFAIRRLRIHGAEPSTLPWVVRLSTREGVGPGDGLHHEAPPSHGDYAASYDSDGDGVPDRLYMSGHNLACVVAGHLDLTIRGGWQ